MFSGTNGEICFIAFFSCDRQLTNKSIQFVQHGCAYDAVGVSKGRHVSLETCTQASNKSKCNFFDSINNGVSFPAAVDYPQIHKKKDSKSTLSDYMLGIQTNCAGCLQHCTSEHFVCCFCHNIILNRLEAHILWIWPLILINSNFSKILVYSYALFCNMTNN